MRRTNLFAQLYNVLRSEKISCQSFGAVAGAGRQAIIDESGTGVNKLSAKIFNPGISPTWP
jgi:hypothetical protein